MLISSAPIVFALTNERPANEKSIASMRGYMAGSPSVAGHGFALTGFGGYLYITV